ncbi:MAG: hypothetical protein LBR34_02535 [Prevotella sp.]|jgi:hypothetical protein|nr:hypothetical protein [Prevotella sp.]
MTDYWFSKHTILILLCVLLFWGTHLAAENRADVVYSENATGKLWTLENDVLRFEISHTTAGAIIPGSFYNKDAGKEYLLPSGNLLFNYTGQFIPETASGVSSNAELFSLKSADEDWAYEGYAIEDMSLSSALSNQLVGKKLIVAFSKENVRLRLVFEIFDGRAGLRYQAFIKNKRDNARMLIEKSDVISLNMPNSPHNLHYVTNISWQSTSAGVAEAAINNKGKDVAKCFINLYSANDGWYMAPEVNWKTQYGPEIPADEGYEYMHRSFAGLTAWEGGSGSVKVSTHPESFQLALRPGEEFEYIAVNLTVFKGDIVDAKMAVEEHLRKRFRYHDTSSTFVVNDWDWFGQGLRTDEYYRNVVVPKTKAAGYEMVMFDDGWNNLNVAGNGLDNSTPLLRDSVEPDPRVSNDFLALTQFIADNGIGFGLWYSNSGGNHNQGNDLAKKSVVAAKKEKIEYMINNYRMVHQAVDLTEYWQNVEETPESQPSDNVYRKNVLTRNMMNELVDKYPQYVVKVTSELDIYPTQGDRNVELGHLPNNGWVTITGANSAIEGAPLLFGHLPLGAVYFSGNPTGKMVDYYMYMSARNVKVPLRPDQWDENGLALMKKFNQWRHSVRIRELTGQIMRPVYFGENWDSPAASNWNIGKGPYLWMCLNDDKSKALLTGTTAERNLGIGMKYPLRWVDETKTYLIEDITLDDTGVFTYHFMGKYTGVELKKQGLGVRFHDNTSGGKAFWIQECGDEEKQVLYADEQVKSFTETLQGNQLTVTATGEPNSTGKIIVYGKTENDAAIANINFDDNGDGSVIVSSIVNNDVPYPGYASEIIYQMKDFHDGMIKSNANIYVTEVDNGLGRGDKSSYVRMTALNDYVVYQLEVPFSGECHLSVNYKLSKSSRGAAQLYLVDTNGTETALGAAFDQSTNNNEEMKTLDLGDIQLSAAGSIGLKMKLVGSGVSGSGKVLSLNYLTVNKK